MPDVQRQPPASVIECLRELGGMASRGTLLRVCTRGQLERAVLAGDAVRICRGKYALAEVGESARIAGGLGGVLCLCSAALSHGWAVKTLPARPQLMFHRGRHVDRRADADVHWGRLPPHQVSDGVTDEVTTLAHCMRRLPFDEALSVVDSAMRAGVPRSTLLRIADQAQGAGCAQMRRLADVASELAANPFESCLRAITLDVAGLSVSPQVAIREPGFSARPDLVDERLRIVVEADSFQWHGGRAALTADARRYDLLVIHGWLVLRFAYEHVMLQPAFVHEVLSAAVALAQRRNDLSRTAPGAV